jgi:transcriptional regulator with XRE-family HTH domain
LQNLQKPICRSKTSGIGAFPASASKGHTHVPSGEACINLINSSANFGGHRFYRPAQLHKSPFNPAIEIGSLMNVPSKHHHNESKRPNEMDRYVGSRLRLWRRTMKVDAYALAATIGITYQQLQKYEKGLNRISATRLFAISQALNIPIDYFYQDAETQSNRSGDSALHRILLEGGGAELLKCYGAIKAPTVRKAVLNLLRSIAVEDDVAMALCDAGNRATTTLDGLASCVSPQQQHPTP